jgi:hypothetical protein
MKLPLDLSKNNLNMLFKKIDDDRENGGINL